MRGTKAKRLRREIYGDLSLKSRRYYRTAAGPIVRDERRRAYQAAKKEAEA